MTETDINRLLNDCTLKGSILNFNEIEKLSDGIAMDLMGGMMKTMENRLSTYLITGRSECLQQKS